MATLSRVILILIAALFIVSHSAWSQVVVGLNSQESTPAGQETILSHLRSSGSLRSDYFSSSKTVDDKTDFYGVTAQIKLLPSFGELFDGKIEARFTAPDLKHDDRTPSTARLLEGYMITHLNNADLRVGKQNIAWGRADAINPTDNLTPRDYTVLLPFAEDERFGTTAIIIDYYLTQEHTLTFFTTPFFEPSKLPLPLPVGAVVINDSKPAWTLSNSEVGLKLNKAGGEIDWSASYYHGFSLLPEIRIHGFSSGPGILLDLAYPEMDVFGADVARNYGSYGFRAEAAYISPKNYNSQEPTDIRNYLYYVLAVDRTFLENINLNLQFVGRLVHNFEDPEAIVDPVQRVLAIKNAILFGQQHRSSGGLTSRISDRWLNETLEAELLMIVYFDPMSKYYRPLVTYAFTDRLKGSMGGEIYSAPQDSFLGLLKSNRGWFAELRYTF